jgi:hypothetical protein
MRPSSGRGRCLGPWWRNQTLQQIVNDGGVRLTRPSLAQDRQHLVFVGQTVQALPFAVEHEVLDRRVIRTLRLNEQDRHEGAADLDFVQATRRHQHTATFSPTVAFAFQYAKRLVDAHAQRRRTQAVLGDIRQIPHE